MANTNAIKEIKYLISHFNEANFHELKTILRSYNGEPLYLVAQAYENKRIKEYKAFTHSELPVCIHPYLQKIEKSISAINDSYNDDDDLNDKYNFGVYCPVHDYIEKEGESANECSLIHLIERFSGTLIVLDEGLLEAYARIHGSDFSLLFRYL